MKLKISVSLLMLAVLFGCTSEPMVTDDTTNTSTSAVSEAGPDNQHLTAATDEDSDGNALQVAKSIPDFSTLVAAIEAAGVQNSVINVGPLTIFAPTNEAFDKLPAGTVETLVKPENKEKLGFILKNHVAPANFPDSQLEKDADKGRKLYMASGKYLEVVKKADGLYVGGTKILKTVKVSNGWIHIVGDVILPAED